VDGPKHPLFQSSFFCAINITVSNGHALQEIVAFSPNSSFSETNLKHRDDDDDNNNNNNNNNNFPHILAS
jgi:hypothetical protein